MSLRDRFAAARVLVVGDVMLDRYWFGEVSRISPEAPVPVLRMDRAEERPGGAANAARNAAALGARVALISVVGRDEAGDALDRLLAAEALDSDLLADPGYHTTLKLRLIGRQQQLLRVDFESHPGPAALEQQHQAFQSRLADCDCLLLSDYGKGGLAHIDSMIQAARDLGKTVLVDPKDDDWERYRGASLITPNRGELRQVTGKWRDEADMLERTRNLCERFDLGAILITRGDEGMTLVDRQGSHHLPARAREVYDVSGAGDTVIATLAVSLAAGLPLPEAMRLANQAAGIVVGKFGTAVATADELFAQTEPIPE